MGKRIITPMNKTNVASPGCPASMAELRRGLHERVERIAEVCENFDGGFLAFDKWLWFVEAHLQAER